MVVLFGLEAKELYNNATIRKATTPVAGVFECHDMGGAMYKAFKSIAGELVVREYTTFNEAVEFANL